MADSMTLTFDPDNPAPSLAQSRRSLHAIAELVLAGPQHRRSGTIRLRAGEYGISTVARPDLAVLVTDGGLSVVGTEFAVDSADQDTMVTSTCAALAESAGVDAGKPQGLYADGSGVGPTDDIQFNPLVVTVLLDHLRMGDAALRMLADAETPVLWPEHFDVGITMDEVNYGVSLGDDHVAWPYAYVGPWKARSGEFWNAPFGAARLLSELGSAAGITEFFEEGRRQAAEA
jgi:hypothetical protein